MILPATREMEEKKKIMENALRLYKCEQRRQLAFLATRDIIRPPN